MATHSLRTNKALVRRFIDEIFLQRRFEAVDELVADTDEGFSTFIMQAADGRVVGLTSATAPVWSPDGRFLAVMTATETESVSINAYGQKIHETVTLPVIDVVRADGSGRRTMWTADSEGQYSMTWLP